MIDKVTSALESALKKALLMKMDSLNKAETLNNNVLADQQRIEAFMRDELESMQQRIIENRANYAENYDDVHRDITAERAVTARKLAALEALT